MIWLYFNKNRQMAGVARDQWKARCEAAERDLNNLLSICGRQCYEVCHFCAMPDDAACITGAPNERCNAVWRGPCDGMKASIERERM